MNYIKHISKLKQKKFRKESGEFLVEGIKGVKEALDSGADISLIIIEGNRRDEDGIKDLIKLADSKNFEIEFVGRKDIGTIKCTDVFPGIMAVANIKDFDLSSLTKGNVVCLDRVSDPGNLGTIIRTCDWFGIKNILISENSVDPYNEKTVRATMGSIFHVNIYQSKNIIKDLEYLKSKKYNIISFDLSGKDISDIKRDMKNNNVLLFGSESHGISDELKKIINKSYVISGCGQAESLNLAVSVGIVLSKII